MTRKMRGSVALKTLQLSATGKSMSQEMTHSLLGHETRDGKSRMRVDSHNQFVAFGGAMLEGAARLKLSVYLKRASGISCMIRCGKTDPYLSATTAAQNDCTHNEPLSRARGRVRGRTVASTDKTNSRNMLCMNASPTSRLHSRHSWD